MKEDTQDINNKQMQDYAKKRDKNYLSFQNQMKDKFIIIIFPHVSVALAMHSINLL